MMQIPQNLMHTWIGPRPAPLDWMQTWRDHHPGWDYTDGLWTAAKAYTVYENEFVRGQLVSPILACDQGNDFVDALITRLTPLDPTEIGKAWKTTGNYFVAKMIAELAPDITIFPSHYFIPDHFTGESYDGDGPIYAKQLFGATTGGYGKPSLRGQWQKLKGRVRSSRMRRKL